MSQSKQTIVGKTKRSFLTPHKINSHLICSICLDVFEQPNRLLCGHTFCYICIQQWANSIRKNICPECKTDFGKRKPEKDFIASKLVDELPVKCIHDGCKWQGINCLAKKHQRNCQHKCKKKQNQIQKNENIVVLDEEQEQVIEINKKQAKLQLSQNASSIIIYYARSSINEAQN